MTMRFDLNCGLRLLGAMALAGGLLCLSPAGLHAEPQTYVIDRQHTNVSFSWNHLGISRQSGRMTDVEGTLVIDAEKPEEATIEVILKPASILSGVAELDRALKSPDFFDVGRNPIITFKSTGVKRSGEKAAEVTGDLMILGVTRPVVLDVTLNFEGEHPLAPVNAIYRDKFVVGFSAKTRISRSDWGLKRGTPLVSDEITISIETELLRK